MLAEAVCKLMGFTYAPSEEHYWMHGHSSERDFIYVTTQSLTHSQLAAIAEEVGDERTLLICCKAFRAKADAFPEPDRQEDPAGGAAQMRMGQGRLQPQCRQPRSPADGEPTSQTAGKNRPRPGRKAPAQPDLFASGDGQQ